VLPTIRSRAVPVRASRLSDTEVRAFFAQLGSAVATDAAVASARGSIGALLGATDETRAKARGAAREFLSAVADGPATAMERALRQGPWAARGDFTALLDALADALAADARRAVAGERRVSSGDPAAVLAGVERVMAARERAQGNINPQLLLAVLADELATLGVA
jgi:hypothetical protein